MTINSFYEAFIIKLQALYDVETEITKALPELAKAAADPELKQAFRHHLDETRVHVERLEQIFKILNEKSGKVKVEAIRGLIDDANWVVKQNPPPDVLDIMLISASQYVEHYEMAGYGSASAWATSLGHPDIAHVLEQTLREEQSADATLSQIAEHRVNERAVPRDIKSEERLDEEMNDDEDLL